MTYLLLIIVIAIFAFIVYTSNKKETPSDPTLPNNAPSAGGEPLNKPTNEV
jgi:hypothetical protein